MAEIKAQAVKELRQKTGLGMMDCKPALQESDGDIEKAVEFLRKKVCLQWRNELVAMPARD